MPVIKQYNNEQNVNPSPVEGAAYSIVRFANQEAASYEGIAHNLSGAVKDVGEHIERQEITHSAADLATLHAQLGAQWEQTKQQADPNDPNVARKFMDNVVNPALEKMGGGFATQGAQDFFTKNSAEVRASLFSRSAADQMQMEGKAQVDNLNKVGAGQSEAVYNDPSSLDASLKLLRNAVDAQDALSGDQKNELFNAHQKEMAKAAYLSKIDRNPTAAYQELGTDAPAKYGLDGSDVAELRNRAVTEQRMQIAMGKEAMMLQREDNHRAAESASGAIINNIIQPDGSLRVTPQDYLALKGPQFQTPEGQESQKAMLEFLMGRQREGNEVRQQSDPATKSDFFARATLPPDDPRRLTTQEVLKAAGEEKLTPQDVGVVQKYLDMGKAQGTKGEQKDLLNIMNGMKPAITGTASGVPDPQGSQRFAAFQSEVAQAYADGRAAGKTHVQLTDPKSPDFVGNVAKTYITDMATKTQNMTNAMTNGVTIYRGAGSAYPLPAGTVQNGFKFKGGDPGKAENWEKQ